MTPTRISGANVAYGAPANWNAEQHGECATLSVRSEKLETGEITCASAWRPSREELDLLISGGDIVLTVWGRQPVVSMHVEKMR